MSLSLARLTDQAYIRPSEGAGTTTLTVADNKRQVFNLSAARTVVLPSSGIKSGDNLVLENRVSFDLTVQSSNLSALTRANSANLDATIQKGYVVLEALQDAPTTPAHWRVVDVFEQGVRTASTPFTGAITQNFVMNFTRRNSIVTGYIFASTASASAANFLGIPAGTIQTRFRYPATFSGYTAITVISNNTIVSGGLRIDDDGGGAIVKYDFSNFSGTTGFTPSTMRNCFTYDTDIS